MGDDLERISRLRQEEALRRQQMMRGTPSLAATPDAGDEVLRPALATFKGLRGGPLVTPDAHDATTSGAALLAGMDADDWRRGIILSEILREPVSMRDPLSRPSFCRPLRRQTGSLILPPSRSPSHAPQRRHARRTPHRPRAR